jgi:DNA-binding response OmpR family regulator
MSDGSPAAPARVLIIGGQHAEWHAFKDGLRNVGYEVDTVDDWESARLKLRARLPNMVVLDVTGPEPFGVTLLREVRAAIAVPLVIVSSPEAGVDVAAGLEMGATDVVITPIRTREVVARIGAVLRRVAANFAETGPEATSESFLYAGPLVIDRNHRMAIIGERSVYLRPIEYRLLLLLASTPGRVRTRDELTDRLWGDGSPRSNQSLHAQMHNLRVKVEQDPRAPELIKTIKGVGFKLDVGIADDFCSGNPRKVG